MRTAVLLVLCAAAASACGPMAAASAPPVAQSAAIPKALTDLNDAFRRTYADAKRRIVAGADPVIIVGTDTAVLIRGERRTEASVNSPVYHSLKTVAHIPLAIYVTLTPGEGPLDPERRNTLEGLRALIPPARASLAAAGLPAALVARQETIVAESTAFIDEVLARREVSGARLAAFVRRIVPPVADNIADATRAQLDALHAQVSAWRRELGPAAWDRMHVVVVGAHMPRDGAIVAQYFERLLHEPAEGRRIVYAESLWDEPRQLDLLATHLLDGRVGEAFFAEQMRMHRDLLGDAGRAYLLKLLRE
jgi:hypothetical protein